MTTGLEGGVECVYKSFLLAGCGKYMALKQQENSLLNTLKRLRSRIVLLVLRKRMQQYHKEEGLDTYDIMESLSNHIDKLSVFSKEDPFGKEFKATWTIIKYRQNETSKGQAPPEAEGEIANRTLSGLAKYFKTNGTERIMQPYLSEKLQNSTWEHIHTAIRLAHQGDQKNARLHADIANNALKEVAHYMTREGYKELVGEIHRELSKLHF